MESYLTLARGWRHEGEKIKGSRFIADVAPVGSAEAAEDFVGGVRAAFPDATHHCFAYRITEKIFRSADDGEPSGTAGRPMLQAIDGRGLVEVVAVVTRYYGRTKLGAGGLVRAYSSAAAAALDQAGVRTVVRTQDLRVEHPYEVSGEVQSVLVALGLTPVASEYGVTVRFTLRVPVAQAESVVRELTERTAGRCSVAKGDAR